MISKSCQADKINYYGDFGDGSVVTAYVALAVYQLLICCCDKTPRLRQLVEERVYLDLQSRGFRSPDAASGRFGSRNTSGELVS